MFAACHESKLACTSAKLMVSCTGLLAPSPHGLRRMIVCWVALYPTIMYAWFSTTSSLAGWALVESVTALPESNAARMSANVADAIELLVAAALVIWVRARGGRDRVAGRGRVGVLGGGWGRLPAVDPVVVGRPVRQLAAGPVVRVGPVLPEPAGLVDLGVRLLGQGHPQLVARVAGRRP